MNGSEGDSFLEAPSRSDYEKDAATQSSRWAYFGAFQNTVNSIIGTGVIALPYATREGGWLVSLVGLCLTGFVAGHTMKLLVYCMRHIREIRQGKQQNMRLQSGEVTLRDIGYEAFGDRGKYLADVVLIVSQLGGCMAFVAFLADNFADVLGVKKLFVALGLIPILLSMASLNSTSYLAPVSTLANLLFVAAFVAIVYFGTSQMEPRFESLSVINPDGFSKFAGIAIFAFTSHSEIMSIEQFLEPKVQQRYPAIISLSVGISCLLYIGFSVSCYSFFGEDTEDNIFLNIACDEDHHCRTMSVKAAKDFGMAVKAGTTAMIIFIYPFTLYGAVQNIEEILFSEHAAPIPSREKRNLCDPRLYFVDFKRLVVRAISVIFTCLVAASVPKFGFLTSLTGCLSGLLAFSLPPLFYLKLYWQKLRSDSRKATQLFVIANVVLTIGGVVLTFATALNLIISEFA